MAVNSSSQATIHSLISFFSEIKLNLTLALLPLSLSQLKSQKKIPSVNFLFLIYLLAGWAAVCVCYVFCELCGPVRYILVLPVLSCPDK